MRRTAAIDCDQACFYSIQIGLFVFAERFLLKMNKLSSNTINKSENFKNNSFTCCFSKTFAFNLPATSLALPVVAFYL